MRQDIQIIDCEQGAPEWHAARLGMITASRFSDVLAKGQGKTRRAYLLQLAAERLTGEMQETYTNGDMARGVELEAEAREAYESMYGVSVHQIGFAKLDDWIGASPDGLIETDGGLEIKCPRATTHLQYQDDDCLPTVYTPQVQGQLWVTGRKWWDFMSYHPKLEPFIVRVYRDEEYIKNLEAEVNKFKIELQEYIERKTQKAGF